MSLQSLYNMRGGAYLLHALSAIFDLLGDIFDELLLFLSLLVL